MKEGVTGMKKLILAAVVFLLSSCSAGKTPEKGEENEIIISSAVSMEEALSEIKPLFEEKQKGTKLLFNFGSSGALAQQIIQGAPADLFISAAREPFALIQKKGMVDQRLTADVAGNQLVLIQPDSGKAEINSFKELDSASIYKIAIGSPETVPAGKYAKEVLENIGIWNKVKEKLIYAKDASQVLQYVDSGNVDAGIVYKTDAIRSKNAFVRDEADQSLHSEIVYPVGVLKDSRNKKEAEAFFNFLLKEEAQQILKKHGFKAAP